ncbi:hypothetical protein [Microcoleus sp. K5-D4]|uniref:hypothetical protein n=1 Tax=Microcoleus sp. K5-D4 TaxID=2818801 RepID=UPI002FD16C07
MKSPSHSKSRLKPTEGRNSTIADFSPLDRTLGPWANPKIRRGLKSPSHSKSRLKPTEEPNQTIADFSPL